MKLQWKNKLQRTVMAGVFAALLVVLSQVSIPPWPCAAVCWDPPWAARPWGCTWLWARWVCRCSLGFPAGQAPWWA